VDIGPQTFTGAECIYPPCYEYAVVTDNFEASLFVLARNPAAFMANYNTAVLAKLNEQGFNKKINKPVALYQKSDCVYVPRP
jgi:hypothetical protein